MTERLRKLFTFCGEKLARFQFESLKSFNLMSLVAMFPKNKDMRTALELQRNREEIAQSRYQECSGELLEHLDRTS